MLINLFANNDFLIEFLNNKRTEMFCSCTGLDSNKNRLINSVLIQVNPDEYDISRDNTLFEGTVVLKKKSPTLEK